MIIFSSMLKLKQNVSKNNIVELVFEWNDTTKYEENKVKGIKWDGNFNQRFGDDKLWLEIEEVSKLNTIAIRHEKCDDDGIIWDTDYVFNENDKILSIQLDKSFTPGVSQNKKDFSTPHFIKLLIDKGYVENDGTLEIIETPRVIDESNAQLIEKIRNEQVSLRLPLVYVYVTEKISEDKLKNLAYRLKGVAHVFVEDVSRKDLGEEGTDNRIELFIPDSASEKMICKKSKTFKALKYTFETIERDIFSEYCNKLIPSSYTWYGIKTEKLLDDFTEKNNALQSVKAEREIELKNKEAEILNMLSNDVDMYKQEIQSLKNEINRLNAEKQGLSIKLNSFEKTPVLCYGDEVDLYPDEIKEMLLKVIKEYLEKNTVIERKSRKKDILQDIFDSNEYEGIIDEKEKKLKALLSNYTGLDPATSNVLKELGFSLEEGKHHHFIFCGDERYKIILSTTPSDHYRGGKNAASEAVNMLF